MPSIEERIEISAPPADVFKLCHDVERRPDWDARVVHAKLLTPGSIRQGTLIRIDVGREDEFLFSWDGEYISYQFPVNSTVKVLDAAPSSPFKTGTEEWVFSAAAGGTRLAVKWEYKLRGIIAAIIDLLGRRASTRRAIQRSLANLKEMAESG